MGAIAMPKSTSPKNTVESMKSAADTEAMATYQIEEVLNLSRA